MCSHTCVPLDIYSASVINMPTSLIRVTCHKLNSTGQRPHKNPGSATASSVNKTMRGTHIPYFFDQTPRLLYLFSLFILVQLLFEGGVYFVGELADSNDG